jgi:PIN domain nuclease of toxin-antitoxin system
MRLLLDTNVLIGLLDPQVAEIEHNIQEAIRAPEAMLHASVASLWEIAIKMRLRKLSPGFTLGELPDLLRRMHIMLLVINERHVLTAVEPEPNTREPFDRLLLAQCIVENFRLVTVDRVLRHHPLAWRAS